MFSQRIVAALLVSVLAALFAGAVARKLGASDNVSSIVRTLAGVFGGMYLPRLRLFATSNIEPRK